MGAFIHQLILFLVRKYNYICTNVCTSEKTLPNCNGQSLQTGFHREVMMMQKFSRLVPAGHTRGRPKIKAIIL